MNTETLKVRLRMRLYRGPTIAVGPGKITLLQAIDKTGSISAAARSLDMSYRRAWVLVDEINQSLKLPATTSAGGGFHGGGTQLTEAGRQLVHHYHAAEEKAMQGAAADIAAIKAMLKD